MSYPIRIIVGALAVFAVQPTHAADDILLRDLTSISDRTVTSFDPDGVKLDNGRLLGWDQIETATVAKDQEAFNKQLKQLSEPLYRIRQRLKIGDYASLETTADGLYPLYKTRKSAAAYMVVQAVMWARLAVGKREAAVEPYLRAFDLLVAEKVKPDLPGNRRLQFDSATGMSSELLPVWFNEKAAAAAFAEVGDAAKTMRAKTYGLYAYAASLAIAGKAFSRVDPLLRALNNGNEEIKQLKTIFELQLAVAKEEDSTAAITRLAAMQTKLVGAAKPAGWYAMGAAQVQSTDVEQQQQGVLNLLRLPAIYHQTNPEVAAAGVYLAMKAMQKRDRLSDSIALRKQLLTKFGSSQHAMRVKAEK